MVRSHRDRQYGIPYNDFFNAFTCIGTLGHLSNTLSTGYKKYRDHKTGRYRAVYYTLCLRHREIYDISPSCDSEFTKCNTFFHSMRNRVGQYWKQVILPFCRHVNLLNFRDNVKFYTSLGSARYSGIVAVEG